VILRLGISIYLAQYLHFGVTGYYYGNVLARLGPVAVGAAYYFSGRWRHAKSLVETPAETGGKPAAVRQA
jgi:Na+-driven multidrug efflux pump